MATLELQCGDSHPIHSKTVGEAEIDAQGNMFVVSRRRAGKNSSRARQSGSRLVDQGTKLQIRWLANQPATFDDAQIERLEVHRDLVGGSLPMDLPIGLFKCADGHWVGTDDVDELIEWIERAVEFGLGSLPLPPLKLEGLGVLPMPMETIGSTKGSTTAWVTFSEPV